MSLRTINVLRFLIVAMVVGILGFGAAIVLHVVGSDPSTPKTELQRAVFAAEEAVRSNPDDSASRIKLAAAYLERGNTSGAVQQAQVAVRLAPKDPTAHYILGLAKSKRGDERGAIVSLKKAATTQGQMAQFYQDAYAALSKNQERVGDDKGAIDSMNKALLNGPENVLLLYERGRLFERLKKWEQALDDYAAALEYVPNYEPAREAFDNLKVKQPAAYAKLQKLYSESTSETPSKKN